MEADEHTPRAETRRLCAEAGVVVDGTFSLAAMNAALEKKMRSRDLTSAEAFAQMDLDGSGSLEGDEVAEALKLMDLPLEPEDLAEVRKPQPLSSRSPAPSSRPCVSGLRH